MKKIFFYLLIAASVLASTTAHAAEILPLGDKNASLKVDYINFTDSAAKDADVDTGIYVGFEGYNSMGKNLYLGFEVGYGYSDGDSEISGNDVTTKVYFIPLELNLKYAIKASKYFTFDFGGGPSFNYLKEEVSGSDLTGDEDDWLFGGQIFLDFNYTFDQFFVGINTKYQVTEDFQDTDHSYSNWRIGGQLGVTF
jgi:hypothetical protein